MIDSDLHGDPGPGSPCKSRFLAETIVPYAICMTR